MTITKADQILDTLIEQNRSFVIYRLPGETSPRFLMQTTGSPEVFQNIEELNDKKGFVIAPFRVSASSPVLLIQPDCFDLDKAVLTKPEEQEQRNREQNSIHNSIDKTKYGQLFDHFVSPLKKEEIKKLVLSRTKTIEKEKAFSPGRSFFKAAEKYIYSYVYLLHTPQTGTWLGSTPEVLLSKDKKVWKTIALAGTRYPNSTQISWDEKNLEEQEVVSSYLHNQLSSFGIIPETKGPYTIKAGELAHLRTDFRFQLSEPYALGTLLRTLHPTPAVSGLPKNEAYQFIKKNEGYDRLYYSGFLGLLDIDGETDIYVNLRCMLIEKSSLTLFAGGGLLASSSPEEEWEETEQKLQTMLGILK
ncbi:isochorismate synthase [Massilibacteroides sp.]|uniref:isochorismate synthase n=1 Tax=Massilibacteroides sp. TaxID=2034766 RepID=UPI0026350E86|nr:isochorismate synthase [Massilibacteroides sp.]MDD4514601.1 isochorismate synthase [Massilibacteroides sp.]